MVQVNKTALVQKEIERLVDEGYDDLQEIYTIICDKHNIQRPAVRRAKKVLVDKLRLRVQILDSPTKTGPRPKAKRSNPQKLNPIEKRILDLLKEKDEEMKFSIIHKCLNATIDYPLLRKKRLSYFIGKLCAAELVTMVRESRYRINMEECNKHEIFL